MFTVTDKGLRSVAIDGARSPFPDLININASALRCDVGFNLFTASSAMLKAARVGCAALLAVLAVNLAAQGKVDCDTHYKNALERLRQKHLPPNRMVVLTRQALRIYDACQTGDFEDAVSFFERLDRSKN